MGKKEKEKGKGKDKEQGKRAKSALLRVLHSMTWQCVLLLLHVASFGALDSLLRDDIPESVGWPGLTRALDLGEAGDKKLGRLPLPLTLFTTKNN